MLVLAGVVALLAGAGPGLAAVAVLLLAQLHLLAQRGRVLHSTVCDEDQHEMEITILSRIILHFDQNPCLLAPRAVE